MKLVGVDVVVEVVDEEVVEDEDVDIVEVEDVVEVVDEETVEAGTATQAEALVKNTTSSGCSNSCSICVLPQG